MTVSRVLVVGAGMAGLTAGLALRADGLEPIIIDKGRAVGGRMATRTIGEARFDHGAQHFGLRDPAFTEAATGWKAGGLVREWFRAERPNEDGSPNVRHVGVGGMRRIPEHLARGLDVRTGVTLTSLETGPHGVTAHAGPEPVAGGVAVVVTAPPPQMLPLLDAGGCGPPSHIRSALEQVEYHASLAVMARLDGPAGLTAGHRTPSKGPIAWMADNQDKGVSPVPAVTIHSTPEFAAGHLDDPAEVWVGLLCEAAASLLASPIVHAVGHRWRYAEPRTTFETGAVGYDAGSPVVLAGEVFAGAKLEGAFLSGRAAAAQLLSKL